ncbi:hypothetical protein OG906_22145 [Streptomyces sp. NBC_01426]|uniref:hypothetical protein n=1 Tax=unclassified Streptomyces TaxID=2593676 RepID=UPI002E30E99C|nr:hypothetical protein [Streptomyces sp. NBC_01426]
MKRRPLVIAAATVGALATAAFALPNLPPNPVTDTLNDRVFKEKSKRFATVADAPTRGGRTFALPGWIPKDATDIRIQARTTGEARLIRFTLGETPLDGPQCTTGIPKAVRSPHLGARWWPGDTRGDERTECRGVHQYQVAVRGKKVYAWTDGTRSPGVESQDGAPAAVHAVRTGR